MVIRTKEGKHKMKTSLKVILLSIVLISSVVGVTMKVNQDNSENMYVNVSLIFEDRISDSFLEQINAQITYSYNTFAGVSAIVPMSAINIINNSPLVKAWEYVSEYSLLQSTDWGVDRIDADIVWGGFDGATTVGTDICGQTIKVAVLDTGIDYTHQDLKPVYKGGYDFINNDDDPLDDHYHGTHVSGTIAAADNSISGSLIGTAPCVELYAVKVLDSRGSGTSAGVAAGIDWAADNGMNIASLSLGSSSPSDVIQAAGERAYAMGVLLVAASGNSGGEPVGYPAAFPEFIAVGSTDKDDGLSSFSSFGDAQEIVAPGRDILSTTPTYLSGKGPFNPQPNYDTLSGTSMATPHVSGVAALMMSANSNLTNVDVRQMLRDSAIDLGEPGWDKYYGYGLLYAPAAVDLALGGSSGGDDGTGDGGDGDTGTSPDTSSMYVESISFVEQGEGFPFTTYYTYVTISVVDGNGNPLEGVSVTITVTWPDGSKASATGTTDSNGVVTFKYESNACGTYHVKIDSLSKDGYAWDSTLGLTEATFTNC
jgi:subtilisin